MRPYQESGAAGTAVLLSLAHRRANRSGGVTGGDAGKLPPLAFSGISAENLHYTKPTNLAADHFLHRQAANPHRPKDLSANSQST